MRGEKQGRLKLWNALNPKSETLGRWNFTNLFFWSDNRLLKFQLPRSPLFGFRAIQSLKQPVFFCSLISSLKKNLFLSKNLMKGSFVLLYFHCKIPTGPIISKVSQNLRKKALIPFVLSCLCPLMAFATSWRSGWRWAKMGKISFQRTSA